MVEIKKTSQTQYDLRYHFVWVPKRRRAVLKGDIAKRIEGMIKYACQIHNFEIFELVVKEDHVHLYVGAKPKYSPSMIANLIKGGTSKKIRQMFPSLEENYLNSSFWQDGYFVRTVGLVDDTIIRKYINKQRDNSARPF